MFSSSHLVYEAVEVAIKNGVKLTVVVVDNLLHPSGLSMLPLLEKANIPTRYTTLTNLPNVINKVSLY